MSRKYLYRKMARFYIGFIDFSLSFDSICHNLLFHQLMKSGIRGQIVKVVQSLYKQLKACVCTYKGLTELSKRIIGTRHGCMLSTLLFAFYLNEFIE